MATATKDLKIWKRFSIINHNSERLKENILPPRIQIISNFCLYSKLLKTAKYRILLEACALF